MSNSNLPMNEKISFIVEHLRTESKHLDEVIESSLEMQAILRESRNHPPAKLHVAGDSESSERETESPSDKPNGQNLQSERTERLNDRLRELRTDIAQRALPVLEGRKQLVEVLKAVDSNAEKTPSLSELATQVDEPLRTELKQLRSDIRSKLNQVHSISMGNQAVLLYTLDFYNRLLTGLSTDGEQSSYYNSTGRSQNHFAGSFVQTKC
jgi:flagellar biosynthesis/type III secretory pathway chaperone